MHPDILIATPGRLMDMIDTRNDHYLDNLHLLDFFVMDEADRMVEMGHFRELDQIL
jgi:ATP-dependent RNA helicase DDX24/MAK5